MATVTVAELVKRYDGGAAAAVDGISFSVAHGELVTLLGPSGCGKTTTLRLIAGLEVPDGGKILFDDQIVSAAEQGQFVPPEAPRRRHGLPELRHLAAHDCLRQRCLSASDAARE